MTVKYDKHYAESPKACGDPFAPFERFVADRAPGLRVLDLGCGQGRDAVLFARAGHEVVGVDLSSVGIEQLRRKADEEGLSIQAEVGDVRTFEPDGTFDVVVLDRVLHMLQSQDEMRQVLDRAQAVVRPGGHVLISEYPKQHDLLREVFGGAEGWTATLDERNFLFVQRDSR